LGRIFLILIFTIDFENEFALVYMTQILPFNDMNAYNLFTSFERIIYGSIDYKISCIFFGQS